MLIAFIAGISFGVSQRFSDDLEGNLSLIFGLCWGIALLAYLMGYGTPNLKEYYAGILMFWLYSLKIDKLSHMIGFVLSLLVVKVGLITALTFGLTLLLYRVRKGLHIYIPMLILLPNPSDFLFSFFSASTAIMLKGWKYSFINT